VLARENLTLHQATYEEAIATTIRGHQCHGAAGPEDLEERAHEHRRRAHGLTARRGARGERRTSVYNIALVNGRRTGHCAHQARRRP